ncbi:MAG: protein-L-isoaspartate O-methyltransferase [Sulfurimonadaceae bacterium]|jgi:protein-L-isoaspartate(D-aspartate) O-methyltransferase
MNSHYELALYLQERGTLTSPLLIESFNSVDRIDFVPSCFYDQAYEDYPLTIGQGQTISQPFTVAFMLDLLELQEEDKVLDIGCGSGWTTALLAHAVKRGSVTALERIPQLLTLAKNNLGKYNFSNIRLELAGKTLGLPEQTFDKILVSAAAEELPFELVQQLNPGGIMVIPIQNEIAVIYKKENERFEQKDFYGFRFVPLVY